MKAPLKRFDKHRPPGPAPWYIPLFLNRKQSNAGLSWRRVKLPESEEECVVLHTADNKLLVVLGIYSYAYVVNPETLVLWRAHQEGGTANRISFHLLALPALTPISNIRQAADQTKAKSSAGVYYESRPISLWECSGDFPAGENTIRAPVSFQECGEILVLADLGDAASAAPINIAILAFDFPAQKVTCFPQDWFNQSNTDFGYQWITRVWRDRRGRICGDGIRIAPFHLDPSGRHRATGLDKWL